MGMSSPEPLYYTADMVAELFDESRHWPRHECVYGELLVTPAPRWMHQEIVRRLVVALSAYVEREPVGQVVISPSDIRFGRKDVLVQPDVFVASREAAGAWDWRDVLGLLLAAEVLSPSTQRNDRFTKRHLYQEEGVALYWIVDADARTVEVWTPADDFPRFEREQLVWHPDGARTPFVLPLAELFRDG
jgi:Uma2 family endonuclease